MKRDMRILELFIRLIEGEKIKKKISQDYNISIRTVERYINIISKVIDKQKNGKKLLQNSVGEYMIVYEEYDF